METKDIIFELEDKLLQPSVRKSTEQLGVLISDDFIEFGSSGKTYVKKDVLVNLPSSPEIKFNMIDFKTRLLADGLVQSFFKTEKTNAETGAVTISQRSSIWRNEEGEWRMIFHQGTPVR